MRIKSMELRGTGPAEAFADQASHAPDRSMPRQARHFLVLALIFAAYVGVGHLAQYRLPPFTTTPLWLPSGFAICAFLIGGRALWPAIFVGACLLRYATTDSLLSALVVGAGNTLEGLAGSLLVNRFAGGAGAYQKADTIFRFVIVVVAVAVIGATFGAASTRWVNGAPGDLVLVWMSWWLSHVTGTLVLAPLALLWTTTPFGRLRLLALGESLVVLGVLFALGLVVFAGRFPSDIKNYPLEFLCMPCFLWAAFRLGRRTVASAMALLAAMATWGTLRGYGPFIHGTPEESVVLVQSYMSVMSIMVTVLAATVAAQKQAEATLEALALTDPLTGLANYRRLIEVLRSEIARSNRTRQPFTVVMLDMNGLKAINDRHGHLTGSRALCRLADALLKVCREVDTAARFGGDEFVLVLPETDADGGHRVLQRIHNRLAADPDSPPISVSGGIAVFPQDGDNPTALVRSADRALYEQKSQLYPEVVVAH